MLIKLEFSETLFSTKMTLNGRGPTLTVTPPWSYKLNFFVLSVLRGRKPVADDDSDMQEEENLMTDQQKEEEAMFKYTYNSFANGKMGVPLERYELPMILDGKSSCSPETLFYFVPF